MLTFLGNFVKIVGGAKSNCAFENNFDSHK